MEEIRPTPGAVYSTHHYLALIMPSELNTTKIGLITIIIYVNSKKNVIGRNTNMR